MDGQHRYIFVTGGVVSSLGKGISAASIGLLLKERGFKVTLQKFDPYLNVDPGTMSPYQHGEVFVTEDGAETDLDLGHYERFIDENLTRASTVTTGAIYDAVGIPIIHGLGRDITVGGRHREVIDPFDKPADLMETVKVSDGQAFILHPGEFVVGPTLEEIGLPDDIVARVEGKSSLCLLYTSDAADERSSVDLGGRRIIKKKNTRNSRRDV